jgi:hypothetical protein
MSKRTVWESSAAPEYGLLTCSSAPRHDSNLRPAAEKLFDALEPAPRVELLHVLMLPFSKRADRIGEYWS